MSKNSVDENENEVTKGSFGVIYDQSCVAVLRLLPNNVTSIPLRNCTTCSVWVFLSMVMPLFKYSVLALYNYLHLATYKIRNFFYFLIFADYTIVIHFSKPVSVSF